MKRYDIFGSGGYCMIVRDGLPNKNRKLKVKLHSGEIISAKLKDHELFGLVWIYSGGMYHVTYDDIWEYERKIK